MNKAYPCPCGAYEFTDQEIEKAGHCCPECGEQIDLEDEDEFAIAARNPSFSRYNVISQL
ncbi:MAG: phage terminase large subunit family protein [Opitutales bacterium]|nr:phage terminase large subunit family protein [Opitutales bacterium]